MRTRGVAIAVALLLLAGRAAAEGADPRVPELERRLAEQSEQLERLRQRLEEVATVASEARSKAEPPASPAPAGSEAASPAAAPNRASSNGAKATAEFGKGATITSEDDSFSVTLRARIQLRYTHRETETDRSTDELAIRRLRLVLTGHALTRDLTYYVQLGFSNQDTEPDLRLPLRDAYVTWQPLRDLGVRVGQMKVPFDRQRVISSSALQMVDRSIVTGELNLDRDVGVQLLSNDLFGLGNRLAYQLGVFGGDGRNRLSDAHGLLFVGRVQLSVFGKFEDYLEADHVRAPTPNLAIGLGGAHNFHTNRDRSTFNNTFRAGQRTDYTSAEADLIFKWAGFSLQSEGIYRQAEDSRLRGIANGAPVVDTTRSGWGWFVQAGYMVTEHLEVTGRHGELRPLGRSAVAFQRESGGGVNWYFVGHALKLQTDYFYLWEERLAQGDHQVRAQFQLFF